MILEPTFSEGNVIGNTNKDLIPILDEDYSSLVIPLPKGSFINPLSKDLSLLEEQITLDDNGEIIDNNLHFDNPISESDFSESVSYTYNSSGKITGIQAVAADSNGLEFVGGFGDYDGGNDVTLAVKDNQNNVTETFSMIGAGQGTLYKDAEKEYIFFSGTDKTTKVNISAISDLVFEDYTGDSLSIETSGSIEGGNITLNDENTEENSGLTLRAGIDTENSISNVFDKYGLIDFFDREMVDINNYGQVVGNDDYIGRDEFFFYDGQNLYYLPGYYSSKAFGINDYGQMIGEGLPTASDTKYRPLIAYSNGSIQEIQYVEGAGGRFNSTQSGGVTYTYQAYGSVRDINNYLELASYQLNIPPNNAPPELGLTPFEDAYFLSSDSTQSVNIGYELLNSDNSRAFGINEPGQVVGINRETNRAFVFDRAGNFVTNLGTLPGGDYSAAYAINNQGQIVGASTSSSGSRAFIYDNGTMQDMGISYTGDPARRVGIDINNVGQAVVTSSAGEPLIYQDGVVTNVNDWLRPEYLSLGYTITEVKGINDLGYIIAQGTFNGSDRGFLLVPTFKELNRNIHVGNISTFGETVLLQGAEVYLEGESIVTQGGSIESKGKTIVNNNLVIDSSITDESVGNPNADSVNSQSGVKVAGGDVLFTDTVNTNSIGEQNLTLKAGAGDIAFKNTVGDTNPVFNLTVEGAGSLTTTSKDLTVDNELKLEVINDLATANISAQGLSDISLGKVGDKTFASTGNVTTGKIDALSLEVLNNGSFTSGDITTKNGDINIISLNQLTVGQLAATKGGIDLISGTEGININGTASGVFGITALAHLDINTKNIESGQKQTESGFSEDSVIFQSNQGAINIDGSVSTYGDVSLASAGNVVTKAITSQDGGVALISATGNVVHNDTIFSMNDVTIASAKDLTITQNIKTKIGTICLASTEGSVKANTVLNSGLDVGILARQNVRTIGIRTNEGNIVLEAELGQTVVNGNIISRGGDVYALGSGKVTTKNVISDGGDISIISKANSVITGYLKTDSENKDGNVYLEALNNVKIANVVDVDNLNFGIFRGEQGTISIAHQQLKNSFLSSDSFKIGDISQSGSIGVLEKSNTTNPPEIINQPKLGITPPAVDVPQIPTKTPRGGNLKDFRLILIYEIFKRILDAGGTAPAHMDEINPITDKPYADEAEFELVKRLNPDQQGRFKYIINNENIPEEERLRMEDVRRGEVDEDGCYHLVLGRQLGSYQPHEEYATEVTGDNSDHLVMESRGFYSFYDGKLNPLGLAYSLKGQTLGSYAEVKTQHEYFAKAVDGNLDDLTGYELNQLKQLGRQIIFGNIVANACNHKFFLSFDNNIAANAIATIYGPQYPTMNIYYIEPIGF
jgi:probable HAF family extracellular repeat protein